MIEHISLNNFIKIEELINEKEITDQIKVQILNIIDIDIVKVCGTLNFFEIYKQLLDEIKEIGPKLDISIGCFKRAKTLDDTCFGQITSIETQIQANGHETILNKAELLTKLYRNNNETNFVTAELDDDIEEKHLNLFINKITIDVFYRNYLYFLKEREDFFFKEWKGVIYKTPEENKTDDDNEDYDIEPTLEEKFMEANFWYTLTRSLAKDDFTKMQDIENQQTYSVLYELYYTKIMGKFEKQKESNYAQH